MHTVRVITVDSRRFALPSPRQMLATDPRIRVVGEASTVRQALSQVTVHHPDVVVISDGLPGLRGLILAATLNRVKSGIGVVLIVSQSDVVVTVDAIRSGVAGIVEEGSSAQELAETVLAASHNATPLLDAAMHSTEILRRLVIESSSPEEDGAAALGFGPNLTPRLVGILDGVVMGMTNREIARCEGLSEQTVSNYVSTTIAALNARGRIGVLREAVFHGWVAEIQRDQNTLNRATRMEGVQSAAYLAEPIV